MIFDCAFVPARYEEDISDTGIERFIDDVLDCRFVEYRQHFLWRGFRVGEESRAKPGSRNDSSQVRPSKIAAFYNAFHRVIAIGNLDYPTGIASVIRAI